ncbi:MAG: hypothetical protein KDB88_01290 [Flavobacteriales bacterium]|nr:hypothetical protein [Flavobacteriales bacterium]
MLRSLSVLALALSTALPAQVASSPDEPVIPLGIPPTERIDVTGDLIADLLITGHTDHIDTDDGTLAGWYRRYVELLPGSVILMRSTRNNSGLYRMAEGETLDTAALARGFHFKQLHWSTPGSPVRFHLLQQSFGMDVPPGWYGTGEYYDEPMVLKSTFGGRTGIASFMVRFTLPAGTILVDALESLQVPATFGEDEDPPPSPLPPGDPFGFRNEREPQVIIPAGIPPDIPVDLDQDEVTDVWITGRKVEQGSGHAVFEQGIRAGEALLILERRDDRGHWSAFQLPLGERLEPMQLEAGLREGRLRWLKGHDHAVLQHAGDNEGWRLVQGAPSTLVYRNAPYGRSQIGVFEVHAEVPGGLLYLTPQAFVPEGQVLEIR